MSKEDVMVSVGIDLDSLKKSLATVQSEMAKAFGDSGKAAGAFGVVINNITKTTNASTNATREKIDALKAEAQAHKTAAEAAKAEGAANVAASKSMEAAAKAQGAADVAAHRASTEAIRAQGTAYKEAFGAQQAQSNAAAAAARAQTAQINAQTAALRNFSAVARSSGGPATNVTPAFIAGGNKKGGKQAGWQAGNAAMQIQDVAVSLQSGMSLAQVIGQQGSQLLSIMGPSGMLVGGAVAVGAAIYTATERSAEGFRNLTESARETNTEIAAMAELGNAETMWSGLSANKDAVKALGKEYESLNKPVQRWIANVDGFLNNGVSGYQRQFQIAQILTESEEARLRVIESIGRNMEMDAEILKNRIDGNEEVADRLERQRDLNQEIAKIRGQSNITEEERDRLEMLAVENARLSQNLSLLKERKSLLKSEAKSIESAKKEYDEAVDARNDASKRELTIDEQIAKSRDKESKLRARAKKEKPADAYKTLAEAEKELKLQLELQKKAAKEQADFERERARKRADEQKDFLDAVQAANSKRIKDEAKKEKDKADDMEEQELRLQEIAIERSGKGKSAIEIAKIELEFREKIKDALEKENHALADKLAKERDILKHEEAINEQLKSPEQKKKERDEQKEREKAERIVRSRERRKAQAAQQVGFGGFVDDKGKPAKAVPNLQPNAPAAGAAGGGAGNAMKVDTLVVKVLKHG